MFERKTCLRLSALSLALMAATGQAKQEDEKLSQIEVIQVSAQKRVENIQHVPIAISAFSDEALKKLGAENLNDLGLYTPGLETNNATATQTTFNIRGITTNDFGIGLDPAVAVYIDGVYVGRRGTSNLNFNDIERVEVLKGPQGTLFGRNSAAGAVNIISKKADEESAGNVSLTLGRYNKRKVEGMYNFALTDNLYLRSSFVHNRRDGYVDVIGQQEHTGNENDWSFRTNLHWAISDKASADFRYDVSNIDQDGRPAATLNSGYGKGNPYGAIESDLEDNNERRKASGLSAEFNYEFGDMLFTSITARREFTRYNSMEDDGSAFDRAYFNSVLDEDQKQFSQELRLTGQSEKLKWTIGANYFDEDIYQDTYVNFLFQTLDGFALTSAGLDPATIPDIPRGYGMAGFFMQIIPQDIVLDIASKSLLTPEQVYGVIALNNYNRPYSELSTSRSQTTSYAAYADATYAVTDKLDLTVGLRYSVDEKTFEIDTAYRNAIKLGFPGYDDIPFGAVFSIPTDSTQKDKWNKLTPRFVLDYQWNRDLMTYVSYAEGFKSGGYNTLGVAPPVKEETVKNLEVGMKSSWLDGKVKLNVSLFSYDYNDLQQHELDGPEGTVPTYNLRNVDAKGKGIEFETQWQATDNLLLSVNYGLLETEYTKWGLFPWEDEDNNTESLVGEPISGMPKHNLYLAADYFHYMEEHTLAFHVDYAYTSERQTIIDGPALAVLPYDPAQIEGLTPDNKIDAYGIANARMTLIADEANYQVSLYVENLFDENYLLAIGGQAMAVGSPIANRALPRMFGVKFSYDF